LVLVHSDPPVRFLWTGRGSGPERPWYGAGPRSPGGHAGVILDRPVGEDGCMSDAPLAEQDLSVLVEEWLTWDEAAAQIGVTPAKVRTMVRDHQLAAAVPAKGRPQGIPALFIVDGEPVKGLPGL